MARTIKNFPSAPEPVESSCGVAEFAAAFKIATGNPFDMAESESAGCLQGGFNASVPWALLLGASGKPRGS